MIFMGMILNKEQDLNDEISRRIATDLREKNATGLVTGEAPDLAEDSEYVRDFQKTGRFSFGWVILILVLVAAGIVVAFNL